MRSSWLFLFLSRSQHTTTRVLYLQSWIRVRGSCVWILWLIHICSSWLILLGVHNAFKCAVGDSLICGVRDSFLHWVRYSFIFVRIGLNLISWLKRTWHLEHDDIMWLVHVSSLWLIHMQEFVTHSYVVFVAYLCIYKHTWIWVRGSRARDNWGRSRICDALHLIEGTECVLQKMYRL